MNNLGPKIDALILLLRQNNVSSGLYPRSSNTNNGTVPMKDVTQKFTSKTVFLMSLAILLGLVWPSEAQNREHQQLMADIRILQEQTLQLQSLIHALGDTLSTVTITINEQGNVTRKALADQRVSVGTLSNDLRIVREKIDDSNLRISSLSQEVEALRLSIPRMPVFDPNLMTDLVDPDDPDAEVLPVKPPLPPPATGAGMSPRRLYDTAWADYTAGQWPLAIAGFETYIRAFPRSEMTDNAQFFIGESLFSEGRFEEAMAAYNQVITTYASGDAVPLAYYKHGLSLDRMDEPELARESYEYTVMNFPDTDAGRLSQQAIERLDRPN